MQYLAVNEDKTLSFAHTTPPKIGSGECLIKVYAAGVNRADILQKHGFYPAPAGESEILGIEACGDIVAISNETSISHKENLPSYKIGDKVFAIVPGGAYAEYVKVKIAHLMKLPEHFSYVQGASIAEAYLTAYQCLFFIAQVKPLANVLIHAGASGVGSAAIQLAKGLNCHVTVTVGSEKKVSACRALGADEVINYKETDFVTYSEQQKQSYDIIIDVVAGEYVNKNIAVCALDGHIVMLSMLGGRYAENIDVAKMLMKRVNLSATTLRSRSDDYKTELIKAFKNDCYHQFEQGLLKPVIYQESSWSDADVAHQVMMKNENIGKIILTLG